MSDAADVVRAFVDAYAQGDRARVRALVDDALEAHVTAADGGVDDTHGAEAFIARLPDLDGADLALTVTQAVEVEPGRVLAMVVLACGWALAHGVSSAEIRAFGFTALVCGNLTLIHAARSRDRLIIQGLRASNPVLWWITGATLAALALVVYVPPGQPFFCVEPVSHVNNALASDDPVARGIVALAAGETAHAWMQLDIARV